LNTDMRKFESSQKDESRAQLLIPLKPIENVELFIVSLCAWRKLSLGPYDPVICISMN